MPYRFGWLTGVDRVLLEWLSDTDIVFSPAILHQNLKRDLSESEVPSYSQVKRRTRAIYNAGFLEQWGETQGKYVLTDLGHRFVSDDLTNEEREKLAEMDPPETLSE